MPHSLYSHTNKLNHWHTATKGLLLAPLFVISTLSPSWLFSTLLFILVVLGNVTINQTSIKNLLIFLSFPLIFVIFGALAAFVNINHLTEDILWQTTLFNLSLSVDRTSQTQALLLITRTLSSVSILRLFAGMVSVTEIGYLSKKLLLPKVFTELLLFTYHFILQMITRANKIRRSQKSRLAYQQPSQSFHAFSLLASGTLVQTLNRTTHFHNNLESRCYNGEMGIPREKRTFGAAQIIGTIALHLCLISLLITLS